MRPIERRMHKLSSEGASDVEIAWRFRRTPRNVRQLMAHADLPLQDDRERHPSGLRPIERRVLHWRQQGADIDEMAARFRRGPAFLRQVEWLAHHKLAR